MRAILIDPVAKSCTEVQVDAAQSMKDVLGCEHLGSRVLRQNEVVLFDDDLKPDAGAGFTLPLPAGSIRCMGKAIVIGSVGGFPVSTQMTALHVERGLFWCGVDHAVS
jgi:hypothetical protein